MTKERFLSAITMQLRAASDNPRKEGDEATFNDALLKHQEECAAFFKKLIDTGYADDSTQEVLRDMLAICSPEGFNMDTVRSALGKVSFCCVC